MSKPIDRFIGRYRFLSNFYYGPWITISGWTFPTVEHAYQFWKIDTPQFMEAMTRKTLREFVISFKSMSPGQAKALVRTKERRPEASQGPEILSIMEYLISQKFHVDDEILCDSLMSTNPCELIEGNYWKDKFWGMCKNEAGEWEGENNLGKILMKRRSSLLRHFNADFRNFREKPPKKEEYPRMISIDDFQP